MKFYEVNTREKIHRTHPQGVPNNQILETQISIIVQTDNSPESRPAEKSEQKHT